MNLKKSIASLLALTSIFVSSALIAGVKLESEFYVFSSDQNKIDLIQRSTELIVDHISDNGFEVYGPIGTDKFLETLDINFIPVNNRKALKDATADYPSHVQITTFLKDIAAKYPKIVKLVSIGKSVKGKDLWMVKLSDNVNVDEKEPEVKYISSMHGDEITGRELMQFLIKDLAEGYGTNPRITRLLDNTEVYIMPSMNPDGSEARRRSNANGQDLNRNFPEITRGDRNTWENREIETQSIMKFQSQRNFALSANFHGGAVCVNYPWDAKKERHTFDSLLQDVSLNYATKVGEMRNSRSFDRGITNGYDWYVLKGGMQDWSYAFHNDMQVTIELSDRKWPSYSKIPAYYKSHKSALIAYLEKVHQGAGFKTRNFESGTVQILKNVNGSELNLGSFGYQNGEFFKVLDEGNYTFNVMGTTQATSTEAAKSFNVDVRNDIHENGNYTEI